MNKGKITISRPSYGDGRNKIAISVKDTDAGVRFLDIEIDLDKFAECITGLSEVDCEIETRNLDVVGKIVERGNIEFSLGDNYKGYRDKERAIEILSENTPDGWTASEYFGSQSSFFTKEVNGESQRWARTSITKWIDRGIT